MKKLCSVCKTEKLKSEFGVDKRKPDGLKYSCKACHNKKNTEYRKANPDNHRKVNLAYARSDRGKALRKANALRRKFWPHLTNDQAVAEHDRLLAEQKNRCALCGKHQSLLNKAFDVDHCHDTGRVRGLLCHACNYAIVGRHTEESLAKLAAYLKK